MASAARATRARPAAARARAEARHAQHHPAVQRLARVGLAARALIWFTIALLALRVAAGQPAEADRQGALRAIAAQPLGELLLAVLVVGFLAYGFWRALQAWVGDRAEPLKRVGSGLRAALYLGFAASTTLFLLHGSKGDRTQPLTARVLVHPGGRWLVGLVGLVVVGVGLGLVVVAARGRFMDRLRGVTWPRAVRAVGTVGLGGRGLVVAVVGGFLCRAALAVDPGKAKGLDGALKSLAGQPYGQVLLVVAALALVAFGLWSLAESAWHRL